MKTSIETFWKAVNSLNYLMEALKTALEYIRAGVKSISTLSSKKAVAAIVIKVVHIATSLESVDGYVIIKTLRQALFDFLQALSSETEE